MNDKNHSGNGKEPSRGINLVLIYSLMLVALLIAIGVAALVVLPFYNRR